MSKSKESGGIGCLGVLLIVFVMLKLTKNIDWSWIWVLSPLWIGIAVWLIVFLSIFLFAGILKFLTK